MEQSKENLQNLTDIIDGLEEANASKGEIEMGMNFFLESKARKKGIPIRGTFELTPLCNFDCKMCYVHLSDDQLERSKNRLLSGDEWISIIDHAIEAGIITALLTGGEAMLHPEFERIFLHLQARGLNVCVNTNGILLTEKRIDFFKKNKPKEIRITLYGADEETYEKVTGRRAYATVISNIQKAKEAGLHLGINITPNRYMCVNDCLALVDLAEAMGVPYLINTSLSEPRKETERDNKKHDFSLDQYIELYKKLSKKGKREAHAVCETDLPSTGTNLEEVKGLRCGAGRSSFAIVWHGKMQPCLSFAAIQFDLKDMLLADAWKKLHHMVCEYPSPCECNGCLYSNLCPVCVVRHAEGAPVGHANPALCERAKRMVAEGISEFTK